MNLEIAEILENFSKVKVLVVGDLMLDRYWWGSVERISPEAPVPIVNLQSESLVVGGAGNVAANIKGLGAEAFLVGIIGNDADGQKLSETLKASKIDNKHLVTINNRPTTVKTRIIAHQQQVSRIDKETKLNLTIKEEEQVLDKIESLLNQIDIVIVSDYAKGLLSENILMRLITTARNNRIKVFVDPKGNNYTKYKNATLLTPNRKEAFEAIQSGSSEQDVKLVGEQLSRTLQLDSLLITEGEDGMTIFEEGNKTAHLEALARHVYDVTGAGDTVIATLAVAVAAGANLKTAAQIANIAAGFVVGEVGTTAITFAKLNQAIIEAK